MLELSSASPDSTLQNGQYAWRQGSELVVAVGSPVQLPAVCIATGGRQDVWHRQSFRAVDNAWLWLIAGGGIGVVVARALFGTTFHLALPLNGQWLADRMNVRRKNYRGFICGMIGFFMGIFLAMLLPFAEFAGLPAMSPVLGLVLAAIMLVYAILSAVQRTVRGGEVLEVRRIDGKYAYLAGAHPMFLAALPEFADAA